jgi:hypothetical protein
MTATTKTIQTRLGTTLGALGLTLLTACGGGDPATVAETAPVLEQPAAVAASICGVTPQITSTPGYEVFSRQTVLLGGLESLVSTVISFGGHADGSETVGLNLTMQDMRETSIQGYHPVETSDHMGVEMDSAFQPGSVACVNGLARVINTGTEITPNYLLSWASQTLPSVPLGAIPNSIINGFELLGNVVPGNAQAVFKVDKALINTTATVQICQLTSSANTSCHLAAVEPDEAGDTQWTFKAPITGNGIYVLSAPRFELAQD